MLRRASRYLFFFFQAEDGIRDADVTGVQTCALPISIVFLRRVLEGAADRSYGIQVARLAGLPREVIERAREVLLNLEREELSRDGRPKLARGRGLPGPAGTVRTGSAAPGAAETAEGGTPPAPSQLGLFAPEEDPVLEEIRSARIEEMTPIQALNFLADLKKRLLA